MAHRCGTQVCTTGVYTGVAHRCVQQAGSRWHQSEMHLPPITLLDTRESGRQAGGRPEALPASLSVHPP